MPNLKDDKISELVETKKAEDGATCRWCEKPVDEWKQGAEDWGEGGMMKWKCCPHCGESQRTSGEEHMEGCLGIIILMAIFVAAMYLYEVITKLT
jgi:hypothetical protein